MSVIAVGLSKELWIFWEFPVLMAGNNGDWLARISDIPTKLRRETRLTRGWERYFSPRTTIYHQSIYFRYYSVTWVQLFPWFMKGWDTRKINVLLFYESYNFILWKLLSGFHILKSRTAIITPHPQQDALWKDWKVQGNDISQWKYLPSCHLSPFKWADSIYKQWILVNVKFNFSR